MRRGRQFWPTVTKFGFSRQIASTKFHVNPSSGCRADTCWRTDGRTIGEHRKGNRRFRWLRTRLARSIRQAVNICRWASNLSEINKQAQFYRLHLPNDVFNAGWFTLYCSGFMVGSKQFILPTNKLNIPKIAGRWLDVCRIWMILDANIGT
jgi:hypothetical protein